MCFSAEVIFTELARNFKGASENHGRYKWLVWVSSSLSTTGTLQPAFGQDAGTLIDDALFDDPGRLDRDLWLSRISDLLLDGTAALGQANLLERVRDGIRRGAVPIDLRGYSHIFVSGPATDGSSPGEQDELPEIQMGLQEIFTREGLRKLIKAYEAKQSLTELRAQLGEKQTWKSVSYRHPAPRVDWTKAIKEEHPIAGMDELISQDYDQDDDEGDPEGGKVIEAVESVTNGNDLVAVSGAGGPSKGEIAPASVSTQINGEDQSAISVWSLPNTQPGAPASPSGETSAPTLDEFSSAGVDVGFAALIEARAQKARENSADEREWLDSTAQKLRAALLGYNLQAKIVGMRLTPNAALIRFLGSDRLRVEDIEAKQSSLLTTHGLRLISISPLPGEIVVGVARPQRQVVSLWDVWGRRKINRNAAGVNTSFVLGLKELDGDILYLNLGGPFAGGQQHEPHTLVAGATGSGKSVLIQALLLDIAATSNISRLGVKARAAGMHLIFAAQRPDANVMPMQLRDNLGNRLILKVASVGTSEIALGVKGAEQLLGLGHLAARLSGEPAIIYAQAPFLSDDDIDIAVNSICLSDAGSR